MAHFTDDKIKTVWNNAQTIEGIDPDTWRKDACDAWISFSQYGQENEYGWEIDHALPVSKDGTDHTNNLRAMHWQNNRSKGDDFPNYTSTITAEGNKNVAREERKVVHQDTINRLKQLYPNNKYLRNI